MTMNLVLINVILPALLTSIVILAMFPCCFLFRIALDVITEPLHK